MDNRINTGRGQLNKANGGFSLIEVIISMVILALISIPLISYFTNSLRSSARMAQRQQATVLAQQVTESMKAENQLIQQVTAVSGDVSYQIPVLTDAAQFDEDGLNIGGFGLRKTEGSGLDAEGTGKAVYITPVQGDGAGAGDDAPVNLFNFDIRVTVSTDVSANLVKRPLIYGIDDTTDVMALETNQQTEALAYFMSANSDYCMTNAGAPQLDKEKIPRLLKRTIVMSVQWDHLNEDGTEKTNDDDKYYVVRVWYEYAVKDGLYEGKTWIDPSLAANLEVKPWVSSTLAEARVKTLSNIYLLYDKQGTAAQVADSELNLEDNIRISLEMAPFSEVPQFYLVCQNPTEFASDDSVYKLTLDCSASVTAINDGDFHSNINPQSKTGQITVYRNDGSSGGLAAEELTGSGTPTRIISIKTEVFEKGTLTEDTAEDADALAVVETTKGG